MLTNKTRVLLILPQDVLDRARILAGKATTAFKLPVSLQIVLRALIDEGLRRDNDARLHANIEEQAKAVRQLRSGVQQARRSARPANMQRGSRLPRAGRPAPSAGRKDGGRPFRVGP